MPTKKKRIAITVPPRVYDIIVEMCNDPDRFKGWPVSKVIEHYIYEGLKVAEEEARSAAKKA